MESVENVNNAAGVTNHEAEVVLNELKNLKSHRDVYRRRGGVLLQVDDTKRLAQEFGGLAIQNPQNQEEFAKLIFSAFVCFPWFCFDVILTHRFFIVTYNPAIRVPQISFVDGQSSHSPANIPLNRVLPQVKLGGGNHLP